MKAIVGLLLVLSLFFVCASYAADKGVPQTVCPVMGGKINKNVYADANGKRVYFCCGMCVEPFKADPAKYIKKLEDQGVAVEKTP